VEEAEAVGVVAAAVGAVEEAVTEGSKRAIRLRGDEDFPLAILVNSFKQDPIRLIGKELIR